MSVCADEGAVKRPSDLRSSTDTLSLPLSLDRETGGVATATIATKAAPFELASRAPVSATAASFDLHVTSTSAASPSRSVQSISPRVCAPSDSSMVTTSRFSGRVASRWRAESTCNEARSVHAGRDKTPTRDLSSSAAMMGATHRGRSFLASAFASVLASVASVPAASALSVVAVAFSDAFPDALAPPTGCRGGVSGRGTAAAAAAPLPSRPPSSRSIGTSLRTAERKPSSDSVWPGLRSNTGCESSSMMNATGEPLCAAADAAQAFSGAFPFFHSAVDEGMSIARAYCSQKSPLLGQSSPRRKPSPRGYAPTKSARKSSTCLATWVVTTGSPSLSAGTAAVPAWLSSDWIESRTSAAPATPDAAWPLAESADSPFAGAAMKTGT
eukprot:Opistho-2@21915